MTGWLYPDRSSQIRIDACRYSRGRAASAARPMLSHLTRRCIPILGFTFDFQGTLRLGGLSFGPLPVAQVPSTETSVACQTKKSIFLFFHRSFGSTGRKERRKKFSPPRFAFLQLLPNPGYLTNDHRFILLQRHRLRRVLAVVGDKLYRLALPCSYALDKTSERGHVD